MNVGGLVNALAAARSAGARLVYTSSFMALGPSGDGALDAERPHPGPPFRNLYERTKARADALAREAAAGGQDVVTLYPGVIYGPGEMTEGNIVARMIADHLNGRLPALVGPGDRRWSYAFVEDVAEGHALALEKGRSGDRFVLGGENATLARVFDLVREITGVPPPRHRIPYGLASAIGRAQWLWAELTGHPPQLTHGEVGVFREEWACDSTRAVREIGYEWRPLAEGLRETVRWLRAQGLVPPAGERLVSLARGELARRVVHVGCVAFALLLRWLTWWQAALFALGAFLFNWQVLPRVGGKGMWRGTDVARGYPVGILAYPLAVLALVLLFRDRLWMAAAGWGILAVGDGMASLVGQAVGGPRLPWNARKGWVGFAAFVACGALAAAFLSAWVARSSLDPGAAHWPRTIGVACALALACALVESLPTTLDDNVTVPLAVALVLPLFAAAEPALLLGDPLFTRRVFVGLAVNVAHRRARLPRAVDRRLRAPSRRSSSGPRSPPASACPASPS